MELSPNTTPIATSAPSEPTTTHHTASQSTVSPCSPTLQDISTKTVNSPIEPQFALQDREVTVQALLRLGQEIFGEAAPKTETDIFLREGGFSGPQYIEFIIIVSEHFRIELPVEYYVGLDHTGSLANLLHCGELRRWT